jgi:hypothetical protein
VDPDGWVMTTAGTLPAEPRCRLSDAQVVVAQVVGVNPAFDLALLEVQGTNLPPIRWAQKPPHVAGTILAAVGMSETPLAIGVMSVPRRDLPGPFPTRVARCGAKRPAAFGKPTAQGYLVDTVHSGEAYEAGIRSGDVILTIAGRDIRDDEDVLNCVSLCCAQCCESGADFAVSHGKTSGCRVVETCNCIPFKMLCQKSPVGASQAPRKTRVFLPTAQLRLGVVLRVSECPSAS